MPAAVAKVLKRSPRRAAAARRKYQKLDVGQLSTSLSTCRGMVYARGRLLKPPQDAILPPHARNRKWQRSITSR